VPAVARIERAVEPLAVVERLVEPVTLPEAASPALQRTLLLPFANGPPATRND